MGHAARDGALIVALGDSLGVGSDPFLRERVAHVHTDSRGGRTAAQGLRRVHGHPRILVFALGTNDFDPQAYARTLKLARKHTDCLILVSIYRHGAVRSLNRRQRAIPGALVAPWANLVTRNRQLVGSDGVHATIRGYRLRAKLIAGRIRACE